MIKFKFYIFKELIYYQFIMPSHSEIYPRKNHSNNTCRRMKVDIDGLDN